MSELPLVSVVMAVYNGSAYLEEAIESILSQTYAKFEFIIINDGSSDDTTNVIKSFSEKDQRIIILNNEHNLGLTKSLNKGVNLAHGEFIARMDADDVSLSNRLKEQVDFLIKNADYVCVGSNVDLINAEGKKTGTVKLPEIAFIPNYLKKRNCFVHGTLMFRSSALPKVGGYDENYQLAQDYELLLRLSNDGQLGNIDRVLYRLRERRGSLSAQKFLKQCYFTALAKTQNQLRLNQSSRLSGLMFAKNYFYSFFIIYKAGIPTVLRLLKIIK